MKVTLKPIINTDKLTVILEQEDTDPDTWDKLISGDKEVAKELYVELIRDFFYDVNNVDFNDVVRDVTVETEK
jgi:hypothetical protein